jgi:hypothetical protein
MVEDYLKWSLYPYVSHNRFPENGGAGEKKLNVHFSMTPDREFLTVHVEKPKARLSFPDVKTTPLIKKLLPLTATQSVFENFRDRALRFYSERKRELWKPCHFDSFEFESLLNFFLPIFQHPVSSKADS